VSYVRDAVIEHVRACNEQGNKARGGELSQLPPRIPVSQIGHCPRQAIFEAARWHPDHPLHVDPTHPFDDYVMEIMEAGNVWEYQTGKALSREFGSRYTHWLREDPALRVGNKYWSGHIDFWIEPCQDYPDGAIIEHKATNPVNFVHKDRLPYLFHCPQVLAYRHFCGTSRSYHSRPGTFENASPPPHPCSSTNIRRNTLPTNDLGSSSRNSMSHGTAYSSNRWRHSSSNSSFDRLVPGRGTTKALTLCPLSPPSTPTTAASITLQFSYSTSSTSRG
jgi:hypothetical protein